jgi:hypothetical protein
LSLIPELSRPSSNGNKPTVLPLVLRRLQGHRRAVPPSSYGLSFAAQVSQYLWVVCCFGLSARSVNQIAKERIDGRMPRGDASSWSTTRVLANFGHYLGGAVSFHRSGFWT